MKMTFKIARMELQKIFYSPIAWLVLIIFAVQSGINFMGKFGYLVEGKELGRSLSNVTFILFSDRGFFASVANKIYMYLPLITMGLMSTEFSSGAIKLLYSSPVSNRQIVLGKFLSMMVFGLAMVLIMFFCVLYGFFSIKMYDFPLVLTGLLGMYLVICTYAAIGLFMSSLTSYQVVAAMGTFATFFVLQMIGGMWQDIEFVRDITFWLSLSGRAGTFINGLICTEDFLYYILVSGLFISFTIFKLKGIREKSPKYISFARYAGAFAIVAVLGYVSTIPYLMKYHDSTRTKMNTLTPNSQKVIEQIKGEITITTYANVFGNAPGSVLPKYLNYDEERYDQYIRFKPDIKMEYKYYYALPIQKKFLNQYKSTWGSGTNEEALKKISKVYDVDPNIFQPASAYANEINLKSELYRLVRKIETEDSKSAIVRTYDDVEVFATESQKTAAFTRLIRELPMVGFVSGHDERSVNNSGTLGYEGFAKDKPFRWSLINNGFDFMVLDLSEPVDPSVDIMVIAESKYSYTEVEMKNLNAYIDRGGNLLIAGDRKRQQVMNPLIERFGVQFMEGQVVEYNKGYTQDLITAAITPEAEHLAYQFENIVKGGLISMEGAVGISYEEGSEFNYTPVLVSDKMENLPKLNNPTFMKQLKKAQEAKREGKIITEDQQLHLDVLAKEKGETEDLGDSEEYVASWNELQTTDFIDDLATFNPEDGEIEGAITVALALERKVGNKDQKIMILGDADCISNGEIGRYRKGINARNFNMAHGIFFWLTDNEAPIDVRRPTPPDNDIHTKESALSFLNNLYEIIIPALLGLIYLLIWLRRRGR